MGEDHYAPIYTDPDRAYEIACCFPVGRALMWEGVETVTPVPMQIVDMNPPRFIPGFELRTSDSVAYLAVVIKNGEVDPEHVIALEFLVPPIDRKIRLADLTNGTIGPTLLAPTE